MGGKQTLADDGSKGLTYADAGVDIAAGAKAVDLMKAAIKATHNENVLAELGTFGAMYLVPEAPQGDRLVAIASTDGVGTRILDGIRADRHETSGAALVAHCINDILVQGGDPHFFLDYYASAKLDPEVAARVVIGAAEECQKHGVALIGGETAEMKRFYSPGLYDFVGTIVGFANRNQIITGVDIVPGDLVVGLASNGLGTNGYTLANDLIFEILNLNIEIMLPWGVTVADELLKPHRCFKESVLPLMQYGYGKSPIKGAAHITGGGLPGNLVRPLPEGCRAVLDPTSWVAPPIFEWIRLAANQPVEDWCRTFNLGIQMCLIVSPDRIGEVMPALEDAGETAWIIGDIREGERGVEFAI